MVTSWGKDKFGRSRFHCKDCGLSFTWRLPGITKLHQRKWFEWWLLGLPCKPLGLAKLTHPKFIRKVVLENLKIIPVCHQILNPNCHLIIDGIWFGRKHCLIVYWDTDLQIVQGFRYTTGERIEEITFDLENLKNNGVICGSVTSDGSPGVRGAVASIYPRFPHQRCLVHIKRQAFALLTQNPKTVPGVQLRELVDGITKIKNCEDRDIWITNFVWWCICWSVFLKTKSRLKSNSKHWWYTHRSLRKTRTLILKALPNVFWYLHNPKIPKDTNELEGRFATLRQHYKQHRGLAKNRRNNYFGWYIKQVINKEEI